jgi:small conductance mechanosensitive channel
MEKEISTVQKLINTAVEFLVNYGFQVLGAIIIMVLGMMLANMAAAALLKLFEKKKLDITLSRFVASGARLGIIAFALLIALGKFGITITPFIAAISAMAFGVSLALQGPLSNYGAGLSIILGRPFVVGDTVTVCGMSGIVHEVKLACTVLTNEDGVMITIPSKHIVGEIIQNSKAFKVVEGVVGIDYSSDPEEATRLIHKTILTFSEISKDAKPQVGIQQFGESSIDIGYRCWVPTATYFQVSYKLNLAIFQAIKKAGIEIPFPRRDVRILSQSEPKI